MTDLVERLKAALADRYRLEREIGAGGMATVYLAEDLKHHRKVALKVLEPQVAELLGAGRFLREIEIAARLTHPHQALGQSVADLQGSPVPRPTSWCRRESRASRSQCGRPCCGGARLDSGRAAPHRLP